MYTTEHINSVHSKYVVMCRCDRAEKLYEEYNQFRAVIKHDGRVHWEPAGACITLYHVKNGMQSIQCCISRRSKTAKIKCSKL